MLVAQDFLRTIMFWAYSGGLYLDSVFNDKTAQKLRKLNQTKEEKIVTDDLHGPQLERLLNSALKKATPPQRRSWKEVSHRLLVFVDPDTEDIEVDPAPSNPLKLRDTQEWLKRAATVDILSYIWLTQGYHNNYKPEEKSQARVVRGAVDSALGALFNNRQYLRYLAEQKPVIKAREELVAIYGDPRIHFADLIPRKTAPPAIRGGEMDPSPSQAEEHEPPQVDNPILVPYEEKVQVFAKGMKRVLNRTSKLKLKHQAIVSKYAELLTVHIGQYCLKRSSSYSVLFFLGHSARAS